MNNKLISGLCRQLDASPTSRHVVEYLAKQLLNNGFTDCTNHKEIQSKNSNGFITRAGSLVVWRTGSQDIRNGFHIVGAHTDSPGLKLKPQPDESRFGWQTLQVEIYGSPLLNSWLDRDLGIAGHAVLRNGSVRLFCASTPLATLSQLMHNFLTLPRLRFLAVINRCLRVADWTIRLLAGPQFPQ